MSETVLDTRQTPGQAETFLILEMMVIAMAVVFVVLGTYARSFGDTANSRLATVVALTKFGTWYIDRPQGEDPISFEQRTIDKVMVDGRMLSSKPPMLPLFMTGEYLVLNRVFGLSLDDADDTNEIIRYISMTLIGGSYLLVLIFFMKTARLFVDDPLSRFIGLFALAFCTQLWGYGTNINNHVPGAAMIAVAVYYGLGLASGKLDPAPWRFFLFGLSAGLVPTVDMPGSIFPFFVGLYLLKQLPSKTLRWAALGAAIPLGVHLAIMLSISGNPLPVQMRRELYLSESSYWRNPRGIDALNEPKLVYFFHMTFGRCGIFSLYPITFLGIVAAMKAMVNQSMNARKLILGGLAGMAVLTTYYVLRTNNYGGEAFGFRWYIVAMPILMLMALPWLATTRQRWKWLVVGLLVGVSFYSAWQCSVSPWGANREWTCRFLGTSY